MTTKRKSAVIGIDLGGTEFRYSVFEIIGGKISETALFSGNIPTQKGAIGLQTTMQEAYASAKAAATKHKIIAMGVGSPGRPLSAPEETPPAFVIAPGSAANLETTPGELNGVNMQKLLQQAVPKVPIYMNNDAIVQMQAMVVEVMEKPGRSLFINKKIGYIGLGTGLGGGFANVSSRGEISPHTDGHIYDILLSMPEDIKWLQQHNATLDDRNKIQFDAGGNSVRAEDILSGTGFFKMAGRSSKEFISKEDAETIRPALQRMGRGLAELVTKIFDGSTFQKIDPSANWPAADHKKVKGTHSFLMGGGMANNPFLMRIIEETAQEKLRASGIKTVKFASEPNKETTLAAANLVPKKLLEKSMEIH